MDPKAGYVCIWVCIRWSTDTLESCFVWAGVSNPVLNAQNGFWTYKLQKMHDHSLKLMIL